MIDGAAYHYHSIMVEEKSGGNLLNDNLDILYLWETLRSSVRASRSPW